MTRLESKVGCDSTREQCIATRECTRDSSSSVNDSRALTMFSFFNRASGSHAPDTPTAPDKVVWVSLDPVRKKIDFYPLPIATRIEHALKHKQIECKLGSDFFNATVHLTDPRGYFHQTTPGQMLGRAGYKIPGLRSVRRLLLSPNSNKVQVHACQVQGEWRITDEMFRVQHTFDEEIPDQSLILSTDLAPRPPVLRAWHTDDLEPKTPEERQRSIVVWQWCTATIEIDGDPMHQDEEKWCPFLFTQTQKIESAFASGSESANIEFESRAFRIDFASGSSFALQISLEDEKKERVVRRSVKTIGELLEMLTRHESIRDRPKLMERLANLRPGSEAPPEFYCPITQDIMVDPVQTVDNFTYERSAISRWFREQDTSPLTGLHLSSQQLRPDDKLREEVSRWSKDHSTTSATSERP